MKIKTLLCAFLLVAIAGLCSAQSYVLYGMTHNGGVAGKGTLFKYDITAGKLTMLESFIGATNGANPYGNVMVYPPDSSLYGVTSGGGVFNDGVLFSLNPSTNKDSVRLNFDSVNGKGPEYGGLTLYNNLLYGLTLYGGTFGFGALYSLNPLNNKDSVYADFDTNGMAYYPAGSALTHFSNGLLYGTTYAGGTYNRGTIISFDPITGLWNTVVSLDTNLGTYPIEGSLVLDPVNDLLYGMTYKGGAGDSGTIFCFNPITGKDSVVLSFTGLNGVEPYGSLVYDTVTNLFYGMTSEGGTSSGGVLFSFDPLTGKDSTIFSFSGGNGAVPLGDLTLGPNNNIYGMTLYGGAFNLGTLFSFNTVTGKDTVLVSFDDTNGASPYGSLTLAKTPVIINTSVANVNNYESIRIFPNPCSSYAIINCNNGGRHTLEVVDLAGREIMKEEFTGKRFTFSCLGMAKGLYILKLDNELGASSVSKLIVE
jgi:uncharacterized repeat protein (TIGR03803 family)